MQTKKHTFIAFIFFSIFLSLCVFGVRIYYHNQQAKARDIALQLKWVFNAGFAGDLVAKKEGFWTNEGLNVSVRPGGGGTDPIKAVLSGDAQFGVATGDQLLLAIEEGAPLVAIGLVYQVNPLSWIVRAESSIRTPADLKGKRVGLTLIDDEALFASMLQKAGLDQKRDVVIVPVKFDLTPFLRKEVDAFPVFRNTQGIELQSALAKQGVPTAFVSPADVGVISYSNVYFTTKRLAQSEPVLVRHFINGALAGWAYATSHPEPTRDIVAMYDHQADNVVIREQVLETALLVNPKGTRIGMMTDLGWKATQDVLLKLNKLKAAIPVKDIFTNEFIE